MVRAFRYGEAVEGGFVHTMGKGVWGAGGRLVFLQSLKNEPYQLHFFSPLAYRELQKEVERQTEIRKAEARSSTPDGDKCYTTARRVGKNGGGRAKDYGRSFYLKI